MIRKSICKINIGLYITSRREDGYHLLESLFYPVHSLFDLVEVIHSDDDSVTFTQSGIMVECEAEDNLCVKAYRAFCNTYPIGGVRIHLHKMVPFGAGIGGGSANAATVIHLLNIIFSTKASDEQLCEIAKKVGSDVPFFIYNKPLMVYGTGDIFEPTDINLTGRHITIVKPNFAICTREAYSRITPKQPQHQLKEMLKGNWKEITNDFEAPICNDRMREIKQKLYDLGAYYVSMSGSGSAIYAISNEALNISDNFKDEFTHQGILS